MPVERRLWVFFFMWWQARGKTMYGRWLDVWLLLARVVDECLLRFFLTFREREHVRERDSFFFFMWNGEWGRRHIFFVFSRRVWKNDIWAFLFLWFFLSPSIKFCPFFFQHTHSIYILICFLLEGKANQNQLLYFKNQYLPLIYFFYFVGITLRQNKVIWTIELRKWVVDHLIKSWVS